MVNENKLHSLNEDNNNITDEELDSVSDQLLDALQNGARIQDIHGVSNDTMQDIYKLAYDFYHQGKLDDAESLFRFLCIYDFYNPEYAMGMAAVNQLKKNYAKAIEFYALAYSLAKEDYRPMYYAGQCNLMLRQASQAKKCFKIVIERSEDDTLTEKAIAYLASIERIQRDAKDETEKDNIYEGKK